MRRSIAIVLALTLQGGASRANPELLCPGVVRTDLTCDATTAALPEDCGYVRATDDGSIIANDVVAGVPAFHITDPLCADDLSKLIDVPVKDRGVTYLLKDHTIFDANVYGIETNLQVVGVCPGEQFKKVPFVLKTAGAGVIDGERVAAVVIDAKLDAEGQVTPIVSFLTAPLVEDGKKFLEGTAPALVSGVVTLDEVKEPVEPAPTLVLGPGYHTYSLRVVRGERAELFLDGSAVPALIAAYDALPTLDDLGALFPLGGVQIAGGFAIHSNNLETAWARVSVLSCDATPIQIAKLAVEDSASVATQFLPPARATQITRKLTGPGGAASKLDFANTFFDAGQICASVDKHVAAREKTTAAKTQLEGFPVCPGGANCVELAGRQVVLESLAVANLQIDESLISTCTQESTCSGCPPAPTITSMEREDLDPRDGVLDRVCVAADWAVAKLLVACDGEIGTVPVSSVNALHTDGTSFACATDAALPVSCGRDGLAYSVRLMPVGLTGLVGSETLLRRAVVVEFGNPLDQVLDSLCLDSLGALHDVRYQLLAQDGALVAEQSLDLSAATVTQDGFGFTTCFGDVLLWPGFDCAELACRTAWKISEPGIRDRVVVGLCQPKSTRCDDADARTLGDVCKLGACVGIFLDFDGDRVPDPLDNCPREKNPGQEDEDADGRGDACDHCPFLADSDSDGYCDSKDNCPAVSNPDQRDADHDGIGNRCDVEWVFAPLSDAEIRSAEPAVLDDPELASMLAGDRVALLSAAVEPTPTRAGRFTFFNYTSNRGVSVLFDFQSHTAVATIALAGQPPFSRFEEETALDLADSVAHVVDPAGVLRPDGVLGDSRYCPDRRCALITYVQPIGSVFGARDSCIPDVTVVGILNDLRVLVDLTDLDVEDIECACCGPEDFCPPFCQCCGYCPVGI